MRVLRLVSFRIMGWGTRRSHEAALPLVRMDERQIVMIGTHSTTLPIRHSTSLCGQPGEERQSAGCLVLVDPPIAYWLVVLSNLPRWTEFCVSQWPIDCIKTGEHGIRIGAVNHFGKVNEPSDMVIHSKYGVELAGFGVLNGAEFLQIIDVLT